MKFEDKFFLHKKVSNLNVLIIFQTLQGRLFFRNLHSGNFIRQSLRLFVSPSTFMDKPMERMDIFPTENVPINATEFEDRQAKLLAYRLIQHTLLVNFLFSNGLPTLISNFLVELLPIKGQLLILGLKASASVIADTQIPHQGIGLI